MRSASLRLLTTLAALWAGAGEAAIRRDPNGVNVNASGATTVFITFGGLNAQLPAEAFWCGALIPAAPDLGQKCDPATILGRLPIRFDRSSTAGSAFTDIMSIPASVARRAYQAAQAGERSSFFYVRRFVSQAGGPDEYVFVTCRMAGGGARVPFALLDVRLAWDSGEAVAAVPVEGRPPALAAEIAYNGTGRLKGRWEVVLPGDEVPSAQDLLTEASLPPAERGLQRRYTQLERFNAFLPPTGKHTLRGPDLSRLPTTLQGLYVVLLRVEASDDKEADSNLALAGAGVGTVHSGAVAGFPMPVLRYVVGGALPTGATGRPQPLLPAEGHTFAAGQVLDFSWSESAGAAAFRVSIEDVRGEPVLSAIVTPGLGLYRAPAWLAERAPAPELRWRVSALDRDGDELLAGPWRSLRVVQPAP